MPREQTRPGGGTLRVRVTAEDIAAGERHSYYFCPAALAVRRVTGDGCASVYGADGTLYVEAWGLSARAPFDLREFVRGYDSYADPPPAEFELPGLDDPAWQGRCCHCEELFDADELDDEGACEGCRKEAATEED